MTVGATSANIPASANTFVPMNAASTNPGSGTSEPAVAVAATEGDRSTSKPLRGSRPGTSYAETASYEEGKVFDAMMR